MNKRYEMIINTATHTISAFSIVTIIIFSFICILNKLYIMPKAWNIGFILPMLAIYFSSLILQIVCIWNVGKPDETKIYTSCKVKSNIFFSSCIIFLIFIAIFIIYLTLSIILF